VNPDRQRLINSLWKSPLGILLSKYLHSEPNIENLSSIQEQITTRILSDVALRPFRLFVVQVLVEDLYHREIMDRDSMIRISMLSNRIIHARIDDEAESIEYFGIWSALLFIASVPFGSPEFRNIISTIGSRARFWAKESTKERSVDWEAVFSTRFFKDYQVSKAGGAFVSLLGAYSAAHFLREKIIPNQWIQSETTLLRKLETQVRTDSL
jgi:hypothetical protein